MYMNNILPISQVRAQLPSLVEDSEALLKRTLITVKGKVKAVLMSAAELDSLESTLEILSDPTTMEKLRQAEDDIKNGRTTSLEDLKKELNFP